jgi:ornithine cyclodeaminase/alanine dehydrogenase-like protein (mu-crystallin family)
VPPIAILGHDTVLAAVPATAAIDATRAAFEHHANGEWRMPSKVYVDAPPNGDFRAMPAIGDGIAILKWVTSFPQNAARGYPAVAGALLVSNADTGELMAVLDCAAVTSLRTGAAAAVSAQVLAPAEARTVGLVGCGVNGGWVGRCLAGAGYGPGVCSDPRSEVATALAEELGWSAGSRDEAVAQDIVAAVTPGAETVISSADPRSGQHLIALGADAAGKSEVDLDALEGCELFCDEWAQASRGGELASAVSEGMVTREDVTEIGAVITGSAEGRSSAEAVTLFDSTGLAIQDLGIAAAALAALREGRVEADAHVDL